MRIVAPPVLPEEITDFLCANLDTLTVGDLARIHAILKVVIPRNLKDLIGYIEAIGDTDKT